MTTGELETIRCMLHTIVERLKDGHDLVDPRDKHWVEAAIGCGDMMDNALVSAQLNIDIRKASQS